MTVPIFWSVERDGDAVVATCPEPLRYASEDRPTWMATCAGAIRDELRALEIGEGTLLEATLMGEPSPGADLANVLLYNVGIPEAHVHAGVRLRRLEPGGAGAVQRYRRVPVAAVEEEAGALLAAVRVPLTDGHELETECDVWVAARRAVTAALPAGEFAPAGGIDLRLRLTAVTARMRGSVDLVKKLLAGACASFHLYAGANLDEVARRLALELGEDAEALRLLLVSPAGALLGPSDHLSLSAERVQVSPADDRIRAAEVAIVAGATPQLEIELRALAVAEPESELSGR